MAKRGAPRKEADPNFPKRQASREAGVGHPPNEAKNATENGRENPPDDSGPDSEGGAETAAGADTEIGLSPDPPPVAESDPEVDTYVCARCRSSIEHGQESCKICSARMQW